MAWPSVSMMSFEKARAIVRRLKLRSYMEWQEWSKSGKRPANIPGNPNKVYRDAGWISTPDWLGYEARVNGSSVCKRLLASIPQRAVGKKRKRAAQPAALEPAPDATEDEEDTECSVCFEEFAEAALSVRTLPCSHRFCAGCVAKVVRQAVLDGGGAARSNRRGVLICCPMCRARSREPVSVVE